MTVEGIISQKDFASLSGAAADRFDTLRCELDTARVPLAAGA